MSKKLNKAKKYSKISKKNTKKANKKWENAQIEKNN